MITVSEALQTISDNALPLPPTRVELMQALGLVLAEDALADLDSPPFDKSAMDGFAVCSRDLADGSATLSVVEVITAGMTPKHVLEPGQAAQIMTGAPVPAGADAVARIEDVTVYSEGGVPRRVVVPDAIQPGSNIVRQGASCRAGATILPQGRLLRAQELGALAEMGRHQVVVHRAPRVAVLATGDELVDVDQVPGPGQIRNSNETMLAAQIRLAGAVPVPLGIARDERAHLRERIAAGLECEVLLLSGGVSAGTLDLVPSELEAAGVRQVFHKVDVKPGKPVWFGVLPGETGAGGPSSPAGRLVFGLPGNPVSSMVCFELFVRTALRGLMGMTPHAPVGLPARLCREHTQRGDRPTYHPARIWQESGELTVVPVPWQGSSDLLATVEANGMVVFPPGERLYEAGEMVEVIGWD